MTKQKYRVWAKITDYAYLDVEAESAEEAEKIARETDGGEFTSDGKYGDWEITDRTEVVE